MTSSRGSRSGASRPASGAPAGIAVARAPERADASPPSDERHFDTTHLRSDLGRRSAHGGAITVSVQVATFALHTLSTVVLARLLAPRDFGLVGMVTAITGFMAMFTEMGLSQATIQRDRVTQGQVSTLFWVNVGVGLTLALLAAALAPVIAAFYGEARVLWITVALASGFLLSGAAVQHRALLNRQMRYPAKGAVDVVAAAAGVGAAIAAARAGFGYWALVALPLVTAATAAAGYGIASGWRPGRPEWTPQVRAMLGFGGHLTGYNVFNYASRNADNVLIGRVWGANALGFYARAYQLLMLPLQQVNAPFAAVAVPALSRLVHEPAEYRRAYLRIVEKLALITLPLFALMIGTADWIIRVALGPGWEPAAPIFLWLSIAGFTQPVNNTTGWLFVTQGRTGEMMRWGIVSAVLTVASFVAGLPWGGTGVAAAYAVSGLVIRTPLLHWWVGRRGPVRTLDLLRSQAAPGLAALCALGTVVALRRSAVVTNPFAGLAASAIIVGLVTLLVLLVMPTGRRALADALRMLQLFRRKPVSLA